MKWSYRHNPDREHGIEMFPSSDNYKTTSVQHEVHGKNSSQKFGFMEFFSLMMVIPSAIFIYKFFYLLVLPLLPISIFVFEMIREVAPYNKLMMYGGSFLVAYLFFRGVKSFFSFSTVIGSIATFIFLYTLGVWGIYILLDYYPQNEALSNTMAEINNLLIFIKSKI